MEILILACNLLHTYSNLKTKLFLPSKIRAFKMRCILLNYFRMLCHWQCYRYGYWLKFFTLWLSRFLSLNPLTRDDTWRHRPRVKRKWQLLPEWILVIFLACSVFCVDLQRRESQTKASISWEAGTPCLPHMVLFWLTRTSCHLQDQQKDHSHHLHNASRDAQWPHQLCISFNLPRPCDF